MNKNNMNTTFKNFKIGVNIFMMTMYVYCVFLWQTIRMTTKFSWKEQKQALS